MTKTLKILRPETPATPRFLRIKDIAERLQVSSRTIRRLVVSGELVVMRIGRSVRVSEAALKNFLTGRDSH